MPIATLALWLGCTGGDAATDTQAVDLPPVADAGPDLQGTVDVRLTLDGSGSYDPEGNPLDYEWFFDHLPDGSRLGDEGVVSFTVNGSQDARQTTFVPDVPGTWVVGLQVWDGAHLGGPDYVVVQVDAGDAAPVADAGPDLVVDLGETVTLDGTRSYDPAGRELSYAWSLVTPAPGSALDTADLAGADTPTPSFTPDHRGTYLLALVVDNGLLRSEADAVQVEVQGPNTAPVASAGADVTGEDCTSIVLDGTASTDAEGDPLSYWWEIQSWPEGAAPDDATLDDPTSATPTFFTSVEGTWVLSLAVFDGEAWSDPDLVTLDLAPRATNTPPTVTVATPADPPMQDTTCSPSGISWSCPDCADQDVTLGDTVTALDADGDPLTYTWEVRVGDATIDDPTSLVTTATLTGLETLNVGICTDNRFVFRLTVTDCPGDSESIEVELVSTCCGLLP